MAVALFVALLPLLVATGGAQAQTVTSGLAVTGQDVAVHFPETVDFTLQASGFLAERAELNFRLSGDPVTSGVQAEMDKPSADLDVNVSLDLSTHYIPPGSEVQYYWTLTGASESVAYTPSKSFVMSDERYTWKELSDTGRRVTVRWYQGDARFGQSLLNTATGALDRLQKDVGASIERPAGIWVYATQDDLLGALPKNIPEWVGGKAFPGLSLVLAAIVGGDEDEVKRVIPHELSHLVLYQATRNPYNSPPAWLDEGIAVHNQEVQDPAEEDALKAAVEESRLLPLKSLSGSFGADEESALLAYAESRSAVDFIVADSRYGPEKLARTIAAFRGGVTYDEAFKAGLGVGVDDIDAQWRASLPYRPVPVGATHAGSNDPLRDLSPTTVAAIAVAGLCAFFFLVGGVVTLVLLLRRRAARA
jgi:hypothetical protein